MPNVHMAAALDQLGRLLGTHSTGTTPAGYASLVGWAEQFGTLVRVGIEGTGSYGGRAGTLAPRPRPCGSRRRAPQTANSPTQWEVRSNRCRGRRPCGAG